MGVVFNNTVVPYMGWNAMFILLGCFTLVSFIMLLFFRPTRGSIIPFDDFEGGMLSGGIDYFDGGAAGEEESEDQRREKKRRVRKEAKR